MQRALEPTTVRPDSPQMASSMGNAEMGLRSEAQAGFIYQFVLHVMYIQLRIRD